MSFQYTMYQALFRPLKLMLEFLTVGFPTRKFYDIVFEKKENFVSTLVWSKFMTCLCISRKKLTSMALRQVRTLKLDLYWSKEKKLIL